MGACAASTVDRTHRSTRKANWIHLHFVKVHSRSTRRDHPGGCASGVTSMNVSFAHQAHKKLARVKAPTFAPAPCRHLGGVVGHTTKLSSSRFEDDAENAPCSNGEPAFELPCLVSSRPPGIPSSRMANTVFGLLVFRVKLCETFRDSVRIYCTFGGDDSPVLGVLC